MNRVMGWLSARARALAGAAALVCVLVMTAPAPGQGFGGPMGGMMPDLVTRRGVTAYCTLLKMDDDQRETAMVLFETTRGEYRATMEAFQRKMEQISADARESQDWQKMQDEMMPAAERMQTQVVALEKRFFEDLRSILTDEQATNWERVERFRRRETMLRFALVSGAGADLIQIVERGKLAPEGNAEFATAFLQYELDMDVPLREMEAMQREQQAKQGEQMKRWRENPMLAMEDMNKLMERANGLAKKVRGINRDYVRRLGSLMSDPSREALETEFAKRSFPRVYRESHASRVLRTALGFGDLTEEQRDRLRTLQEQYTRDLAAANRRWAKAIEDEEESMGGAVGRMMRGFEGGGGQDSEERKARTARRELDDRTLERAEAVLSDSQKDRLPKPERVQNEPWMDMMPNPEDMKDDEE